MSSPLEKLKTVCGGFKLFYAGLPHYPRIFTRDSIITAMLCNDSVMLPYQLDFCAQRQGTKKDPHTGEEPGKIFHEYPPIERNELSTEFNACDTTALFIIGHEWYEKLMDSTILTQQHKEHIEKAVSYILSHLGNYLFMESPQFCGAEHFLLKVTYWKDSHIVAREEGEPIYPVVYTLVHIQNMCALRSAARLLQAKELERTAQKMAQALQKLWDGENSTFFIAIDKRGSIRGISSDALHALFYLEPQDVSPEQIQRIARQALVLETPLGYRTLEPALLPNIKDLYHANTVWPFEQAMINIGAKKFGLSHVEEVSSRIFQFLDTENEIFVLTDSSFQKGGCDPQLWTIGAKEYFKRQKRKS